jgi:hypothetical protein
MSDEGKSNMDLLGSSSDSTLRKLEFEMKLRALDNGGGARTKINSHKASVFKPVFSGLAERPSSARRRDEPSTIYYRSPAKQSRIQVSEDKSQLNESRSLLVKMKDEFRNSTNHSLSGIHSKENRLLSRSNDHILIKSIMIKPKIGFSDQPMEEKKISMENLKSEFYSKLSKQRREMGRGGTLENLFTILNNETRISREVRENGSILSKNRPLEHQKILEGDSKSELPGTSLNRHHDSMSHKAAQQGVLANSFPTDKVKDLLQNLSELTPDHIDASGRKYLILLRAQIKALISS